MQPVRTAASRRITWSPGWRLRAVVVAAALGSFFGLVFGLSSLNRPLLNAAVFYVLGAALAAGFTCLVVVAVRGRRRAPQGGRSAPAPDR